MYRICYFVNTSKFCSRGNFRGTYNLPCFMRDLMARHFVAGRNERFFPLLMQRKPYILEYSKNEMAGSPYSFHMINEVGNTHHSVPVQFIDGNYIQPSLQEYRDTRDFIKYEYVGFNKTDRSKILGYKRKSLKNLRYDIYSLDRLELIVSADPKFAEANYYWSQQKELAANV